MSTPRQLAVAAATPFLKTMVKDVPDDVPIALDTGAMVDAILTAAHPDAVIPAKHRPDEEDITAYRVTDESGRSDNDDGPLPLYAMFRTIVTGRAPVVQLDLVEAESAQQARRSPSVVGMRMHADALRAFGMAAIAAADYATGEHRRLAPEREAESARILGSRFPEILAQAEALMPPAPNTDQD